MTRYRHPTFAAVLRKHNGERVMAIVESTRIPSSALQIGMYVSGLDRPWSETPFPLQGFHVENRDQLELARKLCKFIDVDTVKSRTRIDPRLIQEARPQSGNRFLVREEPSREVLNHRIKMMQNSKPYQISSPVNFEIKQARKIHDKLKSRITSVLSSMVDDGKLAIDNLRPVANELVDSVIRNPNAFAYLTHMENHAENVLNYCVRVATWAVLVGRHLDIKRDALNDLAVAALLCKIGYTTLEPEINSLRGTAPAAIDAKRKHSLLAGLEMLQSGTDFSSRVAKAVANHLERHDGSGYPNGLKGREIPFLGQVLGLADYYESLISYDFRDLPLSSAEAIRQLNDDREVLFDRCLIDEFIQAIGLYPTGSVVKLNGDRMAMVLSQTPTSRLRPVVLLLEGKRGWLPMLGKRVIDLATSDKDQIEGSLPALPGESPLRQKKWFQHAFATH